MMPRLRSITVICLFAMGVAGCSAGGSPAQRSQAAAPAPAVAASSRASPAEVDAQLRTLHDQLHITPAQEPKWNALAQELRNTSQKMQGMEAEHAQTASSMHAPDQMQAHEQILQARMDAMHRIRPKSEQMYASMSPDQKGMWDNVVIRQQVGDCGLLCRSGLGY